MRSIQVKSAPKMLPRENRFTSLALFKIRSTDRSRAVAFHPGPMQCVRSPIISHIVNDIPWLLYSAK